MADTMHLSVISYAGELFSETISYLKVFSKQGELGINPDHSSTISMLEHTDVVYEFVNGDLHSFFVTNGLLSISDNRVVIMSDYLLFYDDLNEKEEISKLKDAKEGYSKAKNFEKKSHYRDLIIQSEAKLRVIEHH
tara:strand:- start:35 stop:442 length:408 start_codon:yes stop_codon:yes gene_type:complete